MGARDQREGYFLKQMVSVDEQGWHLAMDDTYVDILSYKSGMETLKAVATPGSKDTKSANAHGGYLDARNHSLYKSGVGVCQLLREFQTDITYATKEVMPEATKLAWNSMAKLKR